MMFSWNSPSPVVVVSHKERIAKSHGSQCGFCTPGIVMSMYALLRNNPLPTHKEMESAFEGNSTLDWSYPVPKGNEHLLESRNSLFC